MSSEAEAALTAAEVSVVNVELTQPFAVDPPGIDDVSRAIGSRLAEVLNLIRVGQAGTRPRRTNDVNLDRPGTHRCQPVDELNLDLGRHDVRLQGQAR